MTTLFHICLGTPFQTLLFESQCFCKGNIEIRTIGLGGEFQDKHEITWSQNGKMRLVEELSDHLRKIVEKEKNMEIPDNPPSSVP